MSLINILVDLVPCVMGISSQVWGCSPKKGNTEKSHKSSKHPISPKQMNTVSLVNRPGLYSDKFQISILEEIANKYFVLLNPFQETCNFRTEWM